MEANFELDQLKKWMIKNGWDYENSYKFSLKHFPDTGRGMSADCNINKNSVIVTIPKHLMITKDLVLKSNPSLSSSLSTQLLLSTFLISEQKKGKSSFWSTYIRTLPKSYDVPYFGSRHESESLPDYLRTCLESSRSQLEHSYEAAVKSGFQTDFDKFAWAWFTVNTRAVYMPGAKSCDNTQDNMALAPYLDMFNHSCDTSVRIEVRKSSQAYNLITEREMKAGEEAFIHYGPHDNVKLWVEYGFIVPNNPHDSVPVSRDELLDVLRPEKTFSLNNMNIIESNGFLQNMMITSAGLSWNISACIFILTLSSSGKPWTAVFDEELCEKKYPGVAARLISLKLQSVQQALEKLSAVKDKLTSAGKVSVQLLKNHVNLLYSVLECT